MVHNDSGSGSNFGFNQYAHLNGQRMSSLDNTGAWTDLVYANGRKVDPDGMEEITVQFRAYIPQANVALQRRQ